jgi:hypothetical protein
VSKSERKITGKDSAMVVSLRFKVCVSKLISTSACPSRSMQKQESSDITVTCHSIKS